MILNCVSVLSVFLCLCVSVPLPPYIIFEGAMALEDNLGAGLNFRLVWGFDVGSLAVCHCLYQAFFSLWDRDDSVLSAFCLATGMSLIHYIISLTMNKLNDILTNKQTHWILENLKGCGVLLSNSDKSNTVKFSEANEMIWSEQSLMFFV